MDDHDLDPMEIGEDDVRTTIHMMLLTYRNKSYFYHTWIIISLCDNVYNIYMNHVIVVMKLTSIID